jgi:hypothetical protein
METIEIFFLVDKIQFNNAMLGIWVVVPSVSHFDLAVDADQRPIIALGKKKQFTWAGHPLKSCLCSMLEPSEVCHLISFVVLEKIHDFGVSRIKKSIAVVILLHYLVSLLSLDFEFWNMSETTSRILWPRSCKNLPVDLTTTQSPTVNKTPSISTEA